MMLLTLLPALMGFIMMRHDADESVYLKLGEKYKHVIAEFGPGNGTLIHPNWVLTASHVADVIKDSVKISDKKYAITEVIKHKSADLALVKLNKKVSNVSPPKLYNGKVEIGQKIVFVGTGYAGYGDHGMNGKVIKDRKFRGAQNKIENVDQNHNLIIRFDHPASGLALPLEGISGPGDSGGPALMETDSGLYIVGVSSFQDFEEDKVEGMYDALEFYPRVSHYYTWITKNIN